MYNRLTSGGPYTHTLTFTERFTSKFFLCRNKVPLWYPLSLSLNLTVSLSLYTILFALFCFVFLLNHLGLIFPLPPPCLPRPIFFFIQWKLESWAFKFLMIGTYYRRIE